MKLNLSFLSKIESGIALILFVAFCVAFIPAPDHFIRIHDNFDSNFSTRHLLIKSGKFFETDPKAIVPGIMNGLPRGLFPKFTEILGLLMYMFGSLTGFAINFILVRIVAFIGIVLYAKDHLIIKEHQKGLIFLIAAVFACLPFSTMHGITVAGIPIVLWAFNNLRKRVNILLSFLVFAVFPLWSNFILVGVHLILLFGFLALYYSFRAKKMQWYLFMSVAVLTAVYVLSEYMLFYMHWFNTDYHSSRGEFEKISGLNIFGVAGSTFYTFFKGDYSSSNYFGYIFIPFILYVIILFYSSKDLNSSKAIFFLICSIVFSFIISVLDWKSFSFFYEKVPLAKEFNLKRFTNLLPGFFFLLILASVVSLNYKNDMLRISALILLLCSFVFTWRGNISFNNSTFDTTGLKIESGQSQTFRQFFDPGLYEQLKKEMGSDTLNGVVHLGMSPSPSKYAGLNVLDDYQGDYPREYKEEFRKIIEGELNKSEKLKNYFDNWGSRCYLYPAELFENRQEVKNGFLYVGALDVNTDQIKKMGGRYMISSMWIGNSTDLGLELKKVFVSGVDLKRVLLYKII